MKARNKKESGGNVYTVFTSKKKILFSYKARSMWAGYGYDGYEERTLSTAKEVFSCKENGFEPEEKSIEEIYRMIAEGFAFFPANEGTRASEIKDYIKMGFKVAFLRAGDFKRFKKEYVDFI